MPKIHVGQSIVGRGYPFPGGEEIFMFDIAIKEIFARKVRSVLCVTGVLICVFLLSIIQGLSNRLEGTIAGDIARMGDAMYLQQKGVPYPPFGSSIREQAAADVLSAEGVDEDASTPILFVVIEPAENPRDAARVIGVGLIPGRENAFLAGDPADSGSATLDGEAENAVVLGAAAAEFYAAKVGDTLLVRDEEFLVTGILAPTGTANTDNAFLMPLAAAQRVFGRGGMISAVIVVSEDGAQKPAVETSLEEQYANWEVKTQAEIEEELEAALQTPRSILGLINAVVFAVTIIIIMNVMMMSVKEKTREIGTMRAIGTRRTSVLSLIFYESLILSVLGGILGLLAAIPAAFLLEIPLSATFLSPMVFLRILVLIFLTGVFSGLLPGFVVTRISPLEALRYE
jgi:putative ABC transport system permease protein